MNSYRTENYIKDKVIVITGASSGFGKETAKKAAELGGKVVLAARREELLREITQEIRESGGEASYIKTDVRVKDQVNAMAKFAVDTYGRIDVLVNDAGTMPLAYYDQMIEQGQGHIVNISSILGNYPVSGCGVYNVTKAAVRMLGDSLRVESRGKIKVTNIKPTSVANTGLVSTEVDYNAGLSGIYGKIIDAFMGLAIPDRLDTESIHCFDFSPSILADNIIYAIDQPWGVNISELTVRASGEAMFV